MRWRHARPLARALGEFVRNQWPIVECRWVEVRPIRPDERLDLRIKTDLRKEFRILKGTVHLAGEHRKEIDRLARTIRKINAQRVCADARE